MEQKKDYQPLPEEKKGDSTPSISFHKPGPEEVLKILKTNTKTGLTTDAANKLLGVYGANELEKKEEESIWEKVKEQFEDILVRILLVSAVISFLISYFGKREDHDIPAWVEPCVIFSILIVNALVGIYQDLDAERALEALKDLQAQHALVLRDGEWITCNATNLVPGDIVQLSQGNKVPADIRVIDLKTISLKINQSILTGEVNPVSKTQEGIPQDKLTLQDKVNYAFSGTLISSGTAIGVVVETGMKTEIGKIHKSLQEKEDEDTPLKKKLDEFGDLLAKIIGVICLVNWLINIGNFSDPAHGGFVQGALYYFKIAVALAVAAIPEGLPAVITTCLALGTRRMAKKKAIVRTLQSVETLGCTTIICSDKTGTLTTNEMTVKNFLLPGDDSADNIKSFNVSGVSFDTQGEIQGFDSFIDGGFPRNLSLFCQSMSLNNESKLVLENSKTKKDKISSVGLPTEAALKVLVEKIGAYDKASKVVSRSPDQVEVYNDFIHQQFEIISTLEFTRDRKSMSVFCLDKNSKKNVMFIKGAPERVVAKSTQIFNKSGNVVPLSAGNRDLLLKNVKDLAKQGLRCLAIAAKLDCGALTGFDGKSKSHPAFHLLEDPVNYATLEENPVLIGIVAMQDPPRPGVRTAIEKCRKAGISVVMITGDIKETAETIARDIGIVDNDDEVVKTRSVIGEDFEKMSESQQLDLTRKCIGSLNGLIFSRTEPLHKKQLVQIFSKQNQIVAMTGDGVNDAPALKQAHIGIAMGIAGTEVAKEASDMILSDDNFSTIVSAVEEGRAIFSNMKAFIRYMISSNIGEVVSIFTSSMLGIPDGFNSIQLLWVNLVTDGLPATALSFNQADPDIMEKPPRKHDEPIITPWIFFRYMIIGTYVGLATVGIFVYWYLWYDWADDGHQLVSFKQLSRWGDCENWQDFSVRNFGSYDFSKNPCSYFTWGKQMPSTLSLSVLVVIEMFNALNALSEDQSLLRVGIFGNPWLLYAIAGSIFLHCGILYIPFLRAIFGTASLGLKEWMLVVGFSFPVVIIDELLKSLARQRNENAQRRRYSKKD